MKLPLETRIENMAAQLEIELAEAGQITVYNIREYSGKHFGTVKYRAALALVRAGKATLAEKRTERIKFGPRPHDRFRSFVRIVRTQEDAI
jgi:hypothetical protein